MSRYKILGRYKYSKTIKSADTDINLKIDLGRFQEQYSRAQFLLDSMVMTSMVPFMPMQSGTLINVTKAMSAAIAGSGKVVAAAPPMGRFLYYGKNMVDELTGSPFARAGAKKVLVSAFGGKTNARENLNYSKHAHPKAQKEWFDAAKRQDMNKWIRAVKKVAGGGKRD